MEREAEFSEFGVQTRIRDLGIMVVEVSGLGPGLKGFTGGGLGVYGFRGKRLRALLGFGRHDLESRSFCLRPQHCQSEVDRGEEVPSG